MGNAFSAEHLLKEVRCSYFHLWTNFFSLKMSRQSSTFLWSCLLCCTMCFYLSDLLTKSYMTIKSTGINWYSLYCYIFQKPKLQCFFLELNSWAHSWGRVVGRNHLWRGKSLKLQERHASVGSLLDSGKMLPTPPLIQHFALSGNLVINVGLKGEGWVGSSRESYCSTTPVGNRLCVDR